MKRIPVFLMFFCVAVCLYAFSPREYAALNGTMTPITLPDTLVKWWPDSLQPYFLNHVGRHGARFLSSESKVTDLEKFLQEQKRAGNLSVKGTKALALLDLVRTRTGDRWGALTELGRYEEEKIARLTIGLCPELFKTGSVRSISTYVPRVVESQFSFLMPLSDYSSDLKLQASSGREYSELLRPFTYFKNYADYRDSKADTWSPYYDKEVEKSISVRPVKAMLKNGDVITDKKARKLSMDFYAVLQGMDAAEIDCDGSQWYTLAEYKMCAEVANMARYLRNSDNQLTNLPSRSAKPLLLDILTATDDTAESGQIAALRFGHAETLMPLLSLMGLPGASAPDVALTAEAIWQSWRGSEVVPLAANLQIIYLRAPSGTPYVAMLLNETPVRPYAEAPSLIVPLSDWQAAMLHRLWIF